MSTISWLGFALLVPGAIAAVIGHQRLVDIEYRNFHSEWVKDGRSCGWKGISACSQLLGWRFVPNHPGPVGPHTGVDS